MRKKYLHLLSWSLSTCWGLRTIQPPACLSCCLCGLSPARKGTSRLGRPSCSPTMGNPLIFMLHWDFSIDYNFLFRNPIWLQSYWRLFSLGTAEMFKVCLPEMTGICLKCFLKRHNNTTFVLETQMQKLKSSDIKSSWKSHGSRFSLALRPKIKNFFLRRILVSLEWEPQKAQIIKKYYQSTKTTSDLWTQNFKASHNWIW